MDNLFNNILASVTTELSPAQCVITMLAALALGAAIAVTYKKTQDEEYYQRSLAVTLMMLPIILSVIILFVGSNIARAFSMAGTLSIIRFRSAPGDAKDIGFIFFGVAAGLACGIGLYAYGALFVFVLCLVLLILEKRKLFTPKHMQKQLKIVIPEDLNYQHAFDDILDKYTESYALTRIKTTDLGSLFEVVYRVSMLPEQNEQEFINELRCRNGNLSIILSVAPRL